MHGQSRSAGRGTAPALRSLLGPRRSDATRHQPQALAAPRRQAIEARAMTKLRIANPCEDATGKQAHITAGQHLRCKADVARNLYLGTLDRLATVAEVV